jgi:4-methylaminobutanoate oxidase (formaldehyde-forming)
LEKGYRYWSADITPADNPFEAGLGFCVKMDKGDFIGREALWQIRAEGMRRKLCTVTLDGGAPVYGGEPVYVGERYPARVEAGSLYDPRGERVRS